MLMELRKAWLSCDKQPGFDNFKIDHSISKGLGWYFSLPKSKEELNVVEDLYASVPFRGPAFKGPAGFWIPTCSRMSLADVRTALFPHCLLLKKKNDPTDIYHTGGMSTPPEGNRDLQWVFKAIEVAWHIVW